MNKKMLFPYEKIRETQDELIKTIYEVIENKKNLVVHAPTGLGKTAATLSPALEVATKKNLTVVFLTSRHTQHDIVIETLEMFKKRHNVNFKVADIIGKKFMCAMENLEKMSSHDFNEFCKILREGESCEFFNDTKTKEDNLKVLGKKTIEEVEKLSPLCVEKFVGICKGNKVCPYEIALQNAKNAKVIVADYFYIFNPQIRNIFLRKINKTLEELIIIVDEAHNLPERIRELMSSNLSGFVLSRAVKEAEQFNKKLLDPLRKIESLINGISERLKDENEIKVEKQDFISKIKSFSDYDELIERFNITADEVRAEKKASFLGSVASFLEKWPGDDEAHIRFFSQMYSGGFWKKTLSYKCLDPSIITKDIFDQAYSCILMSGTLVPTTLFKDMLGVTKCVEKTFGSPFPKDNRLNLIVPITSSRFSQRDDKQYQQIATILSGIADEVPRNMAIFFPSYKFRDSVERFFSCSKDVILEMPGMEKEKKNKILSHFKQGILKGVCLLGVAGGSFGEGIDLPGEFLECVVVVGVPLQPPSLELRELIKYYDEKFGKGFDYAYMMPAIIKVLQNAGRCIRSETDKGATIFLDERYVWSSYFSCFPKDMNFKISRDFITELEEFFGSSSKNN